MGETMEQSMEGGGIKAMGKRRNAGELLSQVTMVMVMFNFETSTLENKNLN